MHLPETPFHTPSDPAPMPVVGPTVDSLLSVGYGYLYAAEPAGAARAFRAVCAFAPDCAEAWAALGEAVRDAGVATGAVALGRAVRIDRTSWTWRFALADALWADGDTGGALDIFAVLAAERPDYGQARRGLARALAAAGRPEGAVDEYREALALIPGDRASALGLGEVLLRTGDALAAVEALEPLRRRDPDNADLHALVGRAWLALAERDKAGQALEQARALDPDDRTGAAALLATMEATGPEGAEVVLSPAYVRALFDRYADRFDRDLVERLGYAAPTALRRAVDMVAGRRDGLDVLDLGCGTGLAGVAFRDLAGHLAGVDLSSRMVAKARARGVYDDLSVGDAVAALAAATERWDVVVAADVLVYLGDLGPLFAAAARAIRPGGWFAATVESVEGDGYALLPSRRFAHSAGYIAAAAAAAGLGVALMDPYSPRREKGVPLLGLLFLLQRPHSA